MKHLKCIVCKSILPLDLEDSVCHRSNCKTTVEIRKDLIDHIIYFKAFFAGKPITEELYREYLESVGLEERYRRFAYPHNGNKSYKVSRRVWFQTNIAQVHHEWSDEFGRPWVGVNND